MAVLIFQLERTFWQFNHFGVPFQSRKEKKIETLDKQQEEKPAYCYMNALKNSRTMKYKPIGACWTVPLCDGSLKYPTSSASSQDPLISSTLQTVATRSIHFYSTPPSLTQNALVFSYSIRNYGQAIFPISIQHQILGREMVLST